MLKMFCEDMLYFKDILFLLIILFLFCFCREGGCNACDNTRRKYRHSGVFSFSCDCNKNTYKTLWQSSINQHKLLSLCDFNVQYHVFGLKYVAVHFWQC